VTASSHLRGIVIAGVLAAVALALGLATLAMNQTASRAATHPIVPLKLRHPAKVVHPNAAQPSTSKKKTPAAPKPNPNLVAALKAGLPRSVARALAAHPVVVVQLTSQRDDVAKLTSGEARSGAGLAGASFVSVDVDSNGGDVQTLTRLLGQLPIAPASLVYTRPAKLYVTLTGFNDRTTVQQAAANAATASAASPGMG
jgi:type IV secretory pathway VirB10-like protein